MERYGRIVQTMWLVASWVVALGHFAVIVAVIVGGPLAVRRPELLRIHAAVAIAVGSVFAVGADCPFTTWQKYCLRSAHRVPYEGGFIEHYLVRPVTGRDLTTVDEMTIAAIWLVPTVVAYSLIGRRRRLARRRP